MINKPIKNFSETPTPYAIICSKHNQVFLTKVEYDYQMNFPNRTWRCPKCGEESDWDDDNYEDFYNSPTCQMDKG